MIDYIRWLWKTSRCKHESGPSYFIECGMRKVRDCKHCGMFLGEKLLPHERAKL